MRRTSVSPKKGAAKKGNLFGSHKYAGKSALCYKLGVDILMGNLVWIQGLYPAGAWPDIKIFTSCLAHFLEPYERVKANNGYRCDHFCCLFLPFGLLCCCATRANSDRCCHWRKVRLRDEFLWRSPSDF